MCTHAPSRALVLAVHGSALPGAAHTVARLVDSVHSRCGVRPVVGHLDHQGPHLAETLADRPGAVVVPLLLGSGYHGTVDIPAIVAGTDAVLTPTLSGAPEIAHALLDRLHTAEAAQAGTRRSAARAHQGAAAHADTDTGADADADAILLAAAGSSRPGGNGGAEQAARDLRGLLGRERGPIDLAVGYHSGSAPSVPDALASLRARGHRRVLVAAHLLAPGRFTAALDRLVTEGAAWALTRPLADHPLVADLVSARYTQATALTPQPV
ncbi:sirohydrochlorin chelatase [Streptacidiphilus jiangxiensis]|uniref:Sirohydrochlorin ferrochelatase n=1 Tax=Streptacidiphilus jiangxiensis TaxID=235985 RepID=A0A1H7FN60_STRJI|nr:CbiX/SirB N-terminal domain-containing protein [Streptacidiphilus jiangxiensis]SEK27244.1 Sirohydrochlorin ferrochelatase [Streptacidiphilus jiangxiensis]